VRPWKVPQVIPRTMEIVLGAQWPSNVLTRCDQQEVCNYSVRVSNMFSRRDPEFITVLDMSQPSVQALQRIQ